jgi:chromosome segregation protein
LLSEAEALERDRRRSEDERAAAEAELAAARRALAAPVSARDLDLEAALAEAERELADASAELVELRNASQAHGQELAALRRAEATRQAELDTAQRRLADVERRVAEAREQATGAAARRNRLDSELAAARAGLEAALDAELVAARAHETARQRASLAVAARFAAEERLAASAATLATVRARLTALDSRLAEDESRGIARAARRLGGHRLDEDLVIEPEFRPAVEAALAEATRAYVVEADAVTALATERGALVVAERAAAAATSDDAHERRFRERLAAAGGGVLELAVRRDSRGAARRLLARCAWLPDLAACLAIQGSLPPGWVAVPRDGGAAVTDMAVNLGRGESALERRAEAERLAIEVAALEAEHARIREDAGRAAAAAEAAAAAVEAARTEESRAAGVRRSAEDAERLAARQLEALVRESAWHDAQAERLAAELDRADAMAASLGAEPAQGLDPGEGTADHGPDRDAIAAWEARASDLRMRRDRLAESVRTADAARREAEQRRARAEASAQLAEERMTRAERELAAIGERARALSERRDALRDEIASTAERELAARDALAATRVADAEDRERLAVAESAAATARDRLRAADEQLRAADHADLEARLGLDALREGVVAELAGLGPLGIARLRAEGEPQPDARPIPAPAADDEIGDSDEVAALEAALARLAPIWAGRSPAEPAPSASRLGQLRRRFHELGATNPYAVDEYAALKARLEGLEAQAADLETAFARRFEQLFGGGFARLSLTDPSDIGASGIEIVARPPGKKTQALAMLSGGERALTAVALLFAMLEIRPVPFCVLDEVDAALDEANIGRFADALRGLAHTTQFIVITHNRGTIEAADALYGVTSGDDSISRVISLRLDEAQALAARDRTELAPAG